MAWDDLPPSKEEMAPQASSWDAAPPTPEELGRPGKTMGGLASNAVSDAGQMIGGVARGVMHPIDTVKNVATHLPEIGHSMLHSWGLDSADKGHRMQTLADESYEHPVSHVLDAASIAFPAAKALGVGEKAVEGLNIAGKAGEAADGLEHTADLFRAKDLGARTKQFAELGEDEAAALGRRAKTEGITGSARDQLTKARDLDARTGKRVGELRQVGDATGAAPEFPGLLEQIEKELGPKYRTGLESGSAGELDKAKAELMKAQPVREVTPGEQVETATKQGFRPGDETADPFNVMQHEGQFPKDAYTDFRVSQENPIPEYEMGANPNTSALAQKATAMNQWARNEKSLMHPSGAASDVANLVSNQNDSHLAQMLGPDKAKDYLESLSNESDAKKMTQMLEEKRARQLGKTTAPSSLPAQMWHGITDRFGYSLTAKGLDSLANVVRKSPALLGKYGPALVNLGPAALATTAHILMQNDPAFGATLEKAGISQ